jgi:hypothetical protein
MALPIARQGNVLVAWGQIRGRRFQELILQRRTACDELDRTPLNLASARPVIGKENILLIEGMHEVSTYSEEIWQSWGQPEIWRLPHGHISTAFMPGLTGRILRWLAPRLDKPFSPDRRRPPAKSLQPTAAPLLRSTVAENSDARCTLHRYWRRLRLGLDR